MCKLLRVQFYLLKKNGVKNEGIQIATAVIVLERENVSRKIIYHVFLGE